MSKNETKAKPRKDEVLHVFCDTEFTDMLDPGASLISIALVAEDGREVYLENANLKKGECSLFVHDEVLPNLERVPEVCARYPEIGRRLAAWIAQLGQPVALVYDADFDWMQLIQTFIRADGSTIQPANLVRQLAIPHPDMCYDMPERRLAAARAFYQAIDDYFLTTDVPRHNARNDARAMRAAWSEMLVRGIANDLFHPQREAA